MHHVFSSSSTITTSTLTTHEIEQPSTKDMRENIVHSAASTTTFSKTLFSISIIQLAFLWIWQYFIGKAYFFELKEEQSQKTVHVNLELQGAILLLFLVGHEHPIKKVCNRSFSPLFQYAQFKSQTWA